MNKLIKIRQLMSSDVVKFYEPVETDFGNIYEAQKNERGEVWLRFSDGKFYRLESKDRNFDHVADSLINRLRLITA